MKSCHTDTLAGQSHGDAAKCYCQIGMLGVLKRSFRLSLEFYSDGWKLNLNFDSHGFTRTAMKELIMNGGLNSLKEKEL